LAIESALRLKDFLTMVQYGFDGIQEDTFRIKLAHLAEQQAEDPDAVKKSNWYFNQPNVPGKGHAIALEPLPPPDQVSREPITSVDQLKDRFIFYEESLMAFEPDGE